MQPVVDITDWRSAQPALRAIRIEVFVHEQKVPAELEWDEFDADAVHVLARVAQMPVATARLVLECAENIRVGRVGRMAVLKPWRRHGVGTALLNKLIEYARQNGLQALYLHAQTHALAFYARHGFVAEGEEFLEVDIPHRSMRLRWDT